MGGNHRHRYVREIILDIFHQADAVAVGQAHIGEAQVGLHPGDAGLGLAQGGGGKCLQPHAAEGDIEQFPDIRFIVYNQDTLPGHFASVYRARWFREMRKQLSPRLVGR